MDEIEVRGVVGAAAARALARFMDWWLAHPLVDLGVAGVLVGVHAGLSAIWPQADVLRHAEPSHRLIVYGAVATVTSIAAGFNGNAIGAYTAGAGPIFDRLRRVHGGTARRNFRSISGWLWLASVLAVVALLIDRDASKAVPVPGTRGSEWLFDTALAIACTKYARLTSLQDVVLGAADVSRTADLPTMPRRRAS
jgi:hypothetical protein